jgi:single-strand selective monofunctional uracil DNA glycosylase
MTLRPIEITHKLSDSLAPLEFGEPVTHVYNPLVYARGMHDAYLERFGRDVPREVVLVGMNPGPWGMAQTGVPFGDVDFVGDWMELGNPDSNPAAASIAKPADEHPSRPVEGLDCPRNEVSGSRLWGWARERYGEAQKFFERFFVYNYCPLLFLEESGRNRTPNRLSAEERRALFEPCDAALFDIVEYFEPEFVVGVGAFAERRIKKALKAGGELPFEPAIGRILHPSPASPKANRGWAEQAEAEFIEMGVKL